MRNSRPGLVASSSSWIPVALLLTLILVTTAGAGFVSRVNRQVNYGRITFASRPSRPMHVAMVATMVPIFLEWSAEERLPSGVYLWLCQR